MKKRLAGSIVFLFVLILFGFENAKACTCAPSNSPCAVFQQADAVFLATATEITKTEKTYEIKIKLNVDEAFKGVTSKQETVLSQGLCDFSFQAGKTYLVYAKRDKETNFLRVYLCSRTNVLEYAAQDLEFIRLLAAGKSVSSIYGKVTQPTGKENPQSNPLSNIKLALYSDSVKKGEKYVSPKNSDKERETFTDPNGNYRFDNLPAGFHRLKIFLPDGLTALKEEWKISTGNQSCEEYGFRVQIDGRIKGKIITADGQPASQVGVYISNTEYNPYLYLPSAKTDINGEYEIKGAPPGNYKLSAAPNFIPITSGLPFTRYYFPGSYSDSEAKIFNLGYAEKIQDVNLQLPPAPFPKKIQIELVWEDGTPIKPTNIFYQAFAGKAESSPKFVYSDKDGKTTLTIYSGFDYQVYAFGTLEDGRLYETDRINVKAEESAEVIKLVARLRR